MGASAFTSIHFPAAAHCVFDHRSSKEKLANKNVWYGIGQGKQANTQLQCVPIEPQKLKPLVGVHFVALFQVAAAGDLVIVERQHDLREHERERVERLGYRYR
jgi:hypothetical protein